MNGSSPSIAAAPDGRFVIADGATVRSFAPDGTPVSGEIPLYPEQQSGPIRQGLVRLTGGGYAAVWENTLPGGPPTAPAPGSPQSLSFRALDETGQPAGPEISLAGLANNPAVAADPTGGFVVAWATSGGTSQSQWTMARRFDAHGTPLTPEIAVDQVWSIPDVATLPDGGFVVAWWTSGEYRIRVFGPDGIPTGAELDSPWWRIGTDAAGRILVVWGHQPIGSSSVQILARRYAPDGSPLGPEILVHTGDPGERLTAEDLAVRGDGSFLFIWQTDKGKKYDLLARAFTAGGIPEGEALPVQSNLGYQHEADAAAVPDGWVIAWSQDWTQANGVYLRHFTAGCGGMGLCLRDGRFRVEVTWRVPATGQSGTGNPIPRTGDTGVFWFFDPANYELLVKVLDGRGTNGHFWVFYGSLTDVEFDLTITDTQTGKQRTYHNPAGTMASRSDTEAF
jgi:hypothetical protein